jgi:hypothetical protein
MSPPRVRKPRPGQEARPSEDHLNLSQEYIGAKPVNWHRTVRRDPRTKGKGMLRALAGELEVMAKGSGPTMGTLFASQADLAANLGLKERRTHDLLHELIELGYLVMTKRGGRRGDGSRYASEYLLVLPSTCSELQVEDESQPAIDFAAERISTCTEGPTKREELSREKSSSARDAMSDIIRNLQGRFEHPANDRDEHEILQALKGDPDPGVTARYVIAEQERRRKPIGSPGRYIAGRIEAARRGEIDISISGGAPAPHHVFTHTGTVPGWGQPVGGAPVQPGSGRKTGIVSF